MDIRKLQRAIVDGLEDVKAQDIKVYDTSHLTELFDRVVIASGTSNRQTKALAASVRDTVKEAGGHIVAVEGLETGEWVLVDCGDAVVHILQPQLRLYYNLEEIWGDKPVRMKLATGARLAKASEPIDEDQDEREDEAPVRTVRRASNLRPALARLPEGMKEPSPPMGHEDTDADAIATIRKPARKTAAKTPASKAAGTRAAAPRKTAAGTTARKTATKTATKTAAKKAPAKKAPAKTSAAKPAARKRATRSA
ncbi:ribosome silencing factor [Cupriavidus taiwanensis]|uniref:ribosome silencing factor n=1 Tax=Cupriavidus taiwanensis TaxID=164546 RepID=UPI000E0FFCAF|nr:ribosome silencing factor [Cupriavidus taiwanensis]SPA48748.1 conserved hypothetical protein [Cupriavidus taiwanensis]